jgi:hypothetical protein
MAVGGSLLRARTPGSNSQDSQQPGSLFQAAFFLGEVFGMFGVWFLVFFLRTFLCVF